MEIEKNKGWLQQLFISVEQETDTWPRWMLDGVRVLNRDEITTSKSEKNFDRKEMNLDELKTG